eukprot:634666-Rhodomonas_salina.2
MYATTWLKLCGTCRWSRISTQTRPRGTGTWRKDLLYMLPACSKVFSHRYERTKSMSCSCSTVSTGTRESWKRTRRVGVLDSTRKPVERGVERSVSRTTVGRRRGNPRIQPTRCVHQGGAQASCQAGLCSSLLIARWPRSPYFLAPARTLHAPEL